MRRSFALLLLLALALFVSNNAVAADTCDDGVMNCPVTCEGGGTDCPPCEFGIDCGGPCTEACDTCDDGKRCGNSTGNEHCISCFNGCQDGAETGVDCGGSCDACPTCSDEIHNGDEEDVDCGGSCDDCPTCSDEIHNGDEEDVDCGGSCDACPTCSDEIHNGDEEDVDCGGPDCDPCPTCDDGIHNGGELGVDCGPVCDKVCETCFDRIENGQEEGVDCGGPDCDPCPTCEDKIRNGDETGVDCGGSCPGSCPTCTDGVQNGDETGVDCGGSCPNYICPSCEDGIKNQNETGVDCGGVCETECVPTCDDGIQNGQEEGVDCGGPDCNCCGDNCRGKVNLGHSLLNFTLCPEILSAPVLDSPEDGIAVQDWLARTGKSEFSGPMLFAANRIVFQKLDRVVPGRCTTFYVFIFQAYDEELGGVDPTELRSGDIADSIAEELENPLSQSLGGGFPQGGHLYVLDTDYGVNITSGTEEVTVCRGDPGTPLVWGPEELCPGYTEESDDFPWEYIVIAVGALAGVLIIAYIIYRLFFKKQDVLKASSTEMVARDTAEAELDQLSEEDEEDQLA